MSSGKIIKQRRKSTKNIFKITRTMELVATAKLKVAMRNFHNFLAYRDQIFEILTKVSGPVPQHPLLQKKPEAKKVILLGIASNKGLCGNYNSRIVEYLLGIQQQKLQEGKQVALHVIGNKAIKMLQFRQVTLDKKHTLAKDQPEFEGLGPLTNEFISAFQNNEVQEVWLVYNRKAKLVCEPLLPFTLPEFTKENSETQYIFDPSQEKILQSLVPMMVRLELYQAILASTISEQTSRMLAMKTASENAEKMIKQLTRTYNRIRQTQITKEILEVLSGAEKK